MIFFRQHLCVFFFSLEIESHLLCLYCGYFYKDVELYLASRADNAATEKYHLTHAEDQDRERVSWGISGALCSWMLPNGTTVSHWKHGS
ncbi:hypothetical protein B0O99DRAFT_637168 [Bisporella sp. PMI_857]|nr:hypothetical protein B0O99DRAFT_637168 [Bisporella sp. PMI_857]